MMCNYFKMVPIPIPKLLKLLPGPREDLREKLLFLELVEDDMSLVNPMG